MLIGIDIPGVASTRCSACSGNPGLQDGIPAGFQTHGGWARVRMKRSVD